MKKMISISLVVVFLLCSNITNASDNQQNNTIECNDEQNTISITIPIGKIHHEKTQNIDEISIDNFGKLLIPEKPSLPTRIFSIAIPPGAVFTDLHYTLGQKINLPGTYTIKPAPQPQIQNTKNPALQKLQEQDYTKNYGTTYTSTTPFPPSIVEFEQTAGFRHYNLIDVRINPITYIQQTGKLTYYPEITLHIQYKTNPEHNPTPLFYDYEETCEQRAQQFILNYEQATTWNQIKQPKSNQNSFVIITLDSLTSSINELVGWEISKGKNVTVVTTTWINTHYTGYDLAEKIRNFLREKYPSDQWGIQDLLIIGHRDDIPMRQTWQDAGGGKPETDFYYAELTHPDNLSWDKDGDHQYGENSDPIDYYGEINVGRIPWSNPQTVQHICQKSVAYEQNNDPAFKNNILLLAAFVDDNTDGATFMEYLANHALHPWMKYWMKTRIYQFQSTYPKDYLLTHQNVINVWSQGKYAFVSWNAHGSPQGTSFISVDDCQYLNDGYPAIISAASCSNSDTNYLNIGQAMMQQGAVGFLGANKVAYYCPGWDDPTDGSDQSFKYFFKSQITSENHTQGQALQFAITEMYQQNLWNYLRYETFVHSSLWGNPDLGIFSYTKNTPPNKPSTPQGPIRGKINVEHAYTTTTTDPNSDHIYYLFDWDDGTNSGWLGPYPAGQIVEATHKWKINNSYAIMVISQDDNGTKSHWSDPLPIQMPHNNQYYNFPLLQLLHRFLQNHPCLFPFVRQYIIKNLLPPS